MYDDWGCAPDCEYCDNWRAEQEAESRVKAEEYRDRILALPDDDPEKLRWLQWKKIMAPVYDDMLSGPPVWLRYVGTGSDKPIKFKFWDDQEEQQ